jgi:hypothetical protein
MMKGYVCGEGKRRKGQISGKGKRKKGQICGERKNEGADRYVGKERG